MRKRLIPLVAATLCWAIYSSAQAQDPAQNGPQPAPKPAAQAPASQQQSTADSPDQPMSLADMARAARAKKQTDAKPETKTAKLLDDDNMPRGVYAADPAPTKSAAPGSQSPSSPASGGSFTEFRGKVILLDFWASWCGPCRNALPNLKRLQAVYGSADFVVISISEDDDESAWRAFVSSHNMTWPASGLRRQHPKPVRSECSADLRLDRPGWNGLTEVRRRSSCRVHRRAHRPRPEGEPRRQALSLFLARKFFT